MKDQRVEHLKKCPFCGGDADYMTQYGRRGYFNWVECITCGCRTKTFSSGEEEFSLNSTQFAAYAWNRRRDGKWDE